MMYLSLDIPTLISRCRPTRRTTVVPMNRALFVKIIKILSCFSPKTDRGTTEQIKISSTWRRCSYRSTVLIAGAQTVFPVGSHTSNCPEAQQNSAVTIFATSLVPEEEI